MIEVTDEIVSALWRVLPSEVQDGREPADIRRWAMAVLSAVQIEYAVLPRGAQAMHCSTHPETVLRWGSCPICAYEAYAGDDQDPSSNETNRPGGEA